MLRLHDHPLAAECYAVRLMLGLLQLPFETIAVDPYPGGTTPHGDIPVLEDGDAILRDPGLILTYLARTYDPSGTWLPVDRIEQIVPWLVFAATDLSPLNEARRVVLFGVPGDLDTLTRGGLVALQRLEDHLTENGRDGAYWLAGPTPTIADVAVFPAVALSSDGGVSHENYPAIALWQQRFGELPGFVGMADTTHECLTIFL